MRARHGTGQASRTPRMAIPKMSLINCNTAGGWGGGVNDGGGSKLYRKRVP